MPFTTIFKEDSTALQNLANKFDKWAKCAGTITLWQAKYNDNNLLMTFLFDHKFDCIQTYQDICTLANFLRDKNYKINNPPCDNTENIYLAITIYQFEKIVKSFNGIERLNDTDNSYLTDGFFRRYFAGRYITNYQDLCLVASILQDKGYCVDTPPCTEDHFKKYLYPYVIYAKHHAFLDIPYNPNNRDLNKSPKKSVPNTQQTVFEISLHSNQAHEPLQPVTPGINTPQNKYFYMKNIFMQMQRFGIGLFGYQSFEKTIHVDSLKRLKIK